MVLILECWLSIWHVEFWQYKRAIYITIIIKVNWLRWRSVLQSFYSKVVNLVVIEQIQTELIWVYSSNQLSAFHVIVHLDLPLIANILLSRDWPLFDLQLLVVTTWQILQTHTWAFISRATYSQYQYFWAEIAEDKRWHPTRAYCKSALAED